MGCYYKVRKASGLDDSEYIGGHSGSVTRPKRKLGALPDVERRTSADEHLDPG
jgi:hypothetical protein